MRRVGRATVILLAIGVLFAAFAVPALAQEDAENTDAVVTGPPAVEIPEEAATESIPDWTYRYMIPTTLVLAAVVILLTSIRYFTNVVRKRYRTVEE